VRDQLDDHDDGHCLALPVGVLPNVAEVLERNRVLDRKLVALAEG
jgi:hypothetical protein